VRLFLDQMFRRDLAEMLQTEAHDVLRATEVRKDRADDAQILDHACREKRVLITLDEDFGDWAVLPLSRHTGVIRLKINPTTTANAMALLGPLLRGHAQADFENRLVIASPQRIRWIKTTDA
jgi:predicted nuclease of predicted toxin-antitoxin system